MTQNKQRGREKNQDTISTEQVRRKSTNHINKDNYFVIKMEILYLLPREGAALGIKFMFEGKTKKREKNLIKIYNAGWTLRHPSLNRFLFF
jgi:hypothetical protein